MCYVAGWGRTSESGASSQVLREVNVPILSQSVCNSEENYNGWLDGFEDSMLCAGYLDGKLDACQDRVFKIMNDEIVIYILSFQPQKGGLRWATYVH